MSAKNIIVTGGAGYIGSHACKALVENGYTPISIDNLSTGWEDAVKFGPFEKKCEQILVKASKNSDKKNYWAFSKENWLRHSSAYFYTPIK